VASAPQQRAAFDELVALLRRESAVSAHALQRHRDTAAGAALERQLEHTLDRLALLYGRGTYENLSTTGILEPAIQNELRLAEALPEPEAAAAAARAQALLDAARRGVRLHVPERPRATAALRGAYVEPLRPELQQQLWQREQPYLPWQDGAVLVLSDPELDALRAAGDEVDVLFLDADELLDLDAREDRPSLEAELERRLAVARAAPDGVGDSHERHITRLLLDQSTVLRNLRDRLADEHPSAHEALLSILAEHRDLLATRLAAEPPARSVLEDPLAASIDGERDLQTLLNRWSAETEDPAGLGPRFRAVAGAGTRLAELERHSR
jgi:hypothetical protein